MQENLNSDQLALAKLMSDISERCNYAGWMSNLEYVLWDALMNGERKYGHDNISTQDIESLKQYSNKAKSWIFFDIKK